MPNPAITRVSGIQIVPSSTNNNNGFYPPQLTQAEIDAIPSNTVKRGGLLYNADTDFLQTRDGTDAWVNLEVAGAAAGDVVVASHNTGAQPAAEVGLIYYNTDTTSYLGSNAGTYLKFYYSTSAASGVGLVANNYPFTLSSGTAVTAEVAGNQVAGFMYYNTTGTATQPLGLRSYVGTAWQGIYSSLSTATGTGLVANNHPLTLPSGTAVTVEVAGNQVDGFSYYNTTGTATQPSGVRAYIGTAWEGIYSSPSTATGTGLAANNHVFTLPSGTAAAVEVAGNQVTGFAYLNTTASKIKFWTGAAWETITSA